MQTHCHRYSRPVRVAFVLIATVAVVFVGAAQMPALGAEPVSGPSGVVKLGARPLEDTERLAENGMLIRELGRQAVLIAARDGLGLATRDAALREPVQGEGRLDLVMLCVPSKYYRLRLRRGNEELWAAEIPVSAWSEDPNDIVDLTKIVEAMEPLSRGGAVDGLRKAGFAPAAAARKAPNAEARSKVPAEVERLLGEAELLAQITAARKLHSLIAQDGEAAELSGALVRAYSNAGQQARAFGYPARAVFTARALLYAQRMVATGPGGGEPRAWPLWHRGYARAMAGLYPSALADLAEADARAANTGEVAPAWVKVIKPLCNYQTGRLTQIAADEPALASQAMFLAFVTAEHSSLGASLTILQAAMVPNPRSMRLIDALSDRTGPGMRTALLDAAPELVAVNAIDRLYSLDAPDAVSRAAEAARTARSGAATKGLARRAMPSSAVIDADAALARAMVDAADDDRGEPSWAAIGRIVQEEQFDLCRRKASHLVKSIGADAKGYAERVAPLVADHPYGAVIMAYGLMYHAGPSVWGVPLRGLQPNDLELPSWELSNLLQDAGVKPPNRLRTWSQMGYFYADDVAFDRERAALSAEQFAGSLAGDSPDAALLLSHSIERLTKVAPSSPVGVALRIQYDGPSIEPRLVEIEKRWGDHPTVVGSLGLKYTKMHRYEDAERCLLRYVAVSPDRTGFSGLCIIYRKLGRPKEFLQYTEKQLELPDTGLEHARAAADAADYLTELGRLDEALRYAELSARSGAAWGLMTAARVNERLGRWDAAEAWMTRVARGYDSPVMWYVWCLRTGHGDVKAARAAAEAKAAAVTEKSSSEDVANAASTYVLSGDLQNAQRLLKRLYADNRNAWASLHAALLAGDADPATRDAALAAASAPPPPAPQGRGKGILLPPTPPLAKLGAWMRDEWAKPAGAASDLSTPDALLAESTEYRSTVNASEVAYFTARFLEQRGHAAQAREYFRVAATWQPRRGEELCETLAWLALRKQGIDPYKLPLGQGPTNRAATTAPSPAKESAAPAPF